MNNEQFHMLLDRYMTGDLSAVEKEQFAAMLKEDHYRLLLEAAMEQSFMEDVFEGIETGERRERLNERVLAQVHQQQKVRRLRFLRYAAAIVLLAGIGIYGWYRYAGKPQRDMARIETPSQKKIMPGHDGAVLTLADGRKVELDSLGNGVVAMQKGTQVLLQNGQLVYGPAGGTAAETVYNTMTTPRGRQFRLLLPDGTAVWLNAASAIRYPTSFRERERVVEISGEAYFEVAENAAMPFIVKVNTDTRVEVLGTHFNINAYKDEDHITATLLEGAVRIRHGSGNAVLLPGQQASVAQEIRVLKNVDTDRVMAWKNGLFNFEGASLQQVMRQLERWYDIEVVYEKGVPDMRFGGEMSRSMQLPDILTGLQDVRIHFRIEGRKLIVMP